MDGRVFQGEEEYDEMMESEDIKKMKEQHNNFRDSLERKLLESLNEPDSSQLKVIFSSHLKKKNLIQCLLFE